jgi:protein-tyrosine-phosphatase
MYDVSKHKGTRATSASFVNTDDDNPNDTLQRVLHQVKCHLKKQRLKQKTNQLVTLVIQ